MPRTRKKKCKYCEIYFLPASQSGDRQIQCGDPECKKQLKKDSQAKWHHEKNPTYFHGRYETIKAWLADNAGYLHKYRQNNSDYVEKNRQQQKKRDKKRRNRNLDIQDSAFAQDLEYQGDRAKLTNLDIQESAFLYLHLFQGLTSKLRNLDIQDPIDIQLPDLYNRGRFLYRHYTDMRKERSWP